MARDSLWSATAILFSLVACGQANSQTAVIPAPEEFGLELRYLANEGFLVEGAGKRVLIDGLFGEGVTGYPAPSDELRAAVEQGAGEWGDVDVALASHYHRDHFDAGSVARFLEANPSAVFVSTPQAVEALEGVVPESSLLMSRAKAVLPAEGEIERLEIHGVAIEILNLHHGRRTPPVENLGVIVTLGAERFLHFGDTEARMETFEPYLEALRGTELALLPFWFLSSEWRAAMVRDLIRPERIVVAHLPTPDAPSGHFGRWQSYQGLVEAIRRAFPDARFPERTGGWIDLREDA